MTILSAPEARKAATSVFFAAENLLFFCTS